jgi:hypothetical protein
MNSKLRELSQNMRELGKMHQSYKGFGMYSTVSTELQKAILYYSIPDISLVSVDSDEDKVIWYNKSNFFKNNKVIIHYNNNYILCIKKNDTIQILHNHPIPLIDDVMNIFDNNIIEYTPPSYKNNIFTLITQYMDMKINTNKIEKTRLIIGTELYNYMKDSNKTPLALACEFDTYLSNVYEKTVFVMC